MRPDPSTRLRQLQRRFDRAAATFDSADFVHRTTAAGLLERISPVAVNARRVLELGAATGTFSRQLARHFRGSRVLSLDLSHAMLARARRAHWRFARVSELQADAAALPLVTGSIDVVIANQLLPVVTDLPAVLREIARVLAKDGLFAFASLGPDSLHELRLAWGHDAHAGPFADMHVVGDALLQSGLRDPVLDVDALRVDYTSRADLYRDLTACGARGPLNGGPAGLAGRNRGRHAAERLDAAMADSPLGITLELVYGHAFGGGQRPDGEIRVALADIGGRGRTP